ncbi:MAG: sialidase family protein [Planctomycetota bacterium]
MNRLYLFIPALFAIVFAVKAEDLKPPGVTIDFSPSKSRKYIGSPSLAVLPSGEYVASHDFFGPGSTFNTMSVFGSTDKGATWTKRADLKGQWWSTLFVHRGALYLIGTTKEYGFTVIRKSTDGGTTWTEPRDAASGLLLGDGKYHCAPVPMLYHAGRIWRAMERFEEPYKWGVSFCAFMLSAPEDSDLLNAASWTASTQIKRDATWLDGKFGGFLEGNAVVTPDGNIVDILRVDFKSGPEKAAIVHISADGKTASFDPQKDFIDFPGGCKKFTIRADPKGGGYWTLSNAVPPDVATKNPERARNYLALMHSTDLKSWDVRAFVLKHPDQAKHAFQYVDWLFEGDDLIVASRTAFDEPDGTQAHNGHDANFLTFHRVEKFRTLRDAK